MTPVDMISHLPEALLLRILLELTTTKEVVATMVLSKRWERLWKSVPKLVYDDSCENIDVGRFSRFVERSLILHEAPIDTLHFKLTQKSLAVNDIGVWITLAVKCGVRNMCIDIDCFSSKSPAIVPRSLYTGSRMLVSLKLDSVTLMDISTLPSFPTLKTLSLVSVKYPGDEFVRRFLSSCHVLEDLVVKQYIDDNVTIFTVKVPSLKSVTLFKSAKRCTEGEDGFVIDAPSLEYLNIFNNQELGYCVVENDMPNIVEADVIVDHSSTGMTLSSITSAKRLFLCLPYSKEAYSVGTVFHRLVRLKICTCETEWLNLLMRLLNDSPNLRHLNLEKFHKYEHTRPCWNDPSSVPECLLSSLETLEWVGYQGSKEEKEAAAFILRIGRCLKKVTISSTSSDDSKKLEMLKELSMSFRRSPTCQLAFN